MTTLQMKGIHSSVIGVILAVQGAGAAIHPRASEIVPDNFVIPILVVHYFPTNGANVDVRVTGDVGESLEAIREKTRRQTREAMAELEDGSRYRGFVDSNAVPALRYEVAGSFEFLEPLPTWSKPGHRTPMTDYRKILDRIGIKDWVEKKGVKEVWIWGYHGGKVDLWESNMASRFGDVSNSDRDPKDLPVLGKTYTVYHYNYQRGTSEAIEDHMHQIEAVLNYFDGRDRTPEDKWSGLLFWGRFVGSDRTHKIVRPGCGWAHYPPNGERDYDWANSRFVETDMDDWKPDGSGKKTRLNCDRWSGNSLRWFIYWMQHLPGPDNGLSFEGRPLQNWWVFIGDFDLAKGRNLKLVRE
ncbi:MAG TPA: hypothetical protein VJA21_24470 [Verrucomicrobiae bacterium]